MKIWVKAATGLLVCTEGSSQRYIGEEPVEVEETSYYARRLMDGELVKVDAPAAPKTVAEVRAAAKALDEKGDK